MMFKILLLIGLYGLGLSGIVIGGAMAIIGPHAVGAFFNAASGLSDTAGPISDLGSANVESEMRFYALMFVFYGAVLIRVAKNLDSYYKHVPLLLSVFFLAGVARTIGYVTAGKPHTLFIVLITIELSLPIILMGFWLVDRRRS